MPTTMRQWFDRFTQATGETPIAIQFEEDDWNQQSWPVTDQIVPFDTLPTEVLDREFDSGYGLPESPYFVAWSDNYVLYRYEYDGSESLVWLPRHPTTKS